MRTHLARALAGLLLLAPALLAPDSPTSPTAIAAAARGGPPDRETGRDPGLVLRVDRARFELSAFDLASESDGPRFPVAIGSPRHPTPPGDFTAQRVVRNPAWNPGPTARAHGAVPTPPSSDGPLGIGKIPLDRGGIQIHGGAHPLELGKPVSLGCVRVRDEAWAHLVRWLEARGALAPWHRATSGETVSALRRPLRVVVN